MPNESRAEFDTVPPSTVEQLTMLDIAGGIVEIEIAYPGDVVWVHVNGLTRLRICRLDDLTVNDHRPRRKTTN